MPTLRAGRGARIMTIRLGTFATCEEDRIGSMKGKRMEFGNNREDDMTQAYQEFQRRLAHSESAVSCPP